MAKVVLICGKLCSGKSTYAEQLRQEGGAVVLSVDELMLALFGQQAGDRHDEYVGKLKSFLLAKSVELIDAGADVILDWGGWTKTERQFTKEFYATRNIACELHYIDIGDETWARRLQERNQGVLAGEFNAYFVDDGLTEKFDSIFEPPDKEEIDVWLKV